MKKLIEIYDNIIKEDNENIYFNSPCDCCKYFDIEKAPNMYRGLAHPLYHEIYKGYREKIVLMSPKKYMEIIAKFFGVSYDDAMKSTLIDWDKVDRFAKQMKEHKKFELGFLKYLRGGGSQEGRHRALAAMSLGCKQIPVVVIENVEYDEKVELANKYKDLSKEELNDIYINKGYHGITDLDWHNLRRFIDYKL